MCTSVHLKCIRSWYYSIRLYIGKVSAHVQYIRITYVSAITHPTLNLNTHYILFFRSIDYTVGRIFFVFYSVSTSFLPSTNTPVVVQSV